jgi:hypothetical protein
MCQIGDLHRRAIDYCPSYQKCKPFTNYLTAPFDPGNKLALQQLITTQKKWMLAILISKRP